MKMKTIIPAILLTISPGAAWAETFTLQQCRDSAIASNNGLKIARQKIVIAEYDRKIAMANYFPDISAGGAFFYNSRNLSLLPENVSDALAGLGTSMQDAMPDLFRYIGSLTSTDAAARLNEIGQEIDKAFGLDIQNVVIGSVNLKQPVFMGGKIIAANKMARLAQDLAETQYETGRNDVISQVDNAYWQTVSISGKKRLAQDYADLLHQMLRDTEIMEAEGMATRADLLSVKVKANEADMLLTKASNGLVLSKMLLCQLCGMEIGSDIELADEGLGAVPVPGPAADKSLEEIFAARPEIRSLEIAGQIYGRKVAIARADMMPRIALTAGYVVTNPNMYHSFRNDFGGMFNVGVAVDIPIIHGCEAMQKVRKAKAEAVMTSYRIEDAKEKISLQVEQLRQRREEASGKLDMARSNLECAEENLRTATVGYTEGVVPANTVLAAQTAWMQAHSEYIDAGVALQVVAGEIGLAEMSAVPQDFSVTDSSK